MKKNVKKAIALVLCTMLLLLVPFSVSVHADNSYTYNYDYWGEFTDSPDPYAVGVVITSQMLGLETNMSKPQSVAVFNNLVYVCDSGNNRILILEKDGVAGLRLVGQPITEFKGSVDPLTFSNPTDLAISEDGNIFIADKGNKRILKLDANWNYLMQFDKPNDASLSDGDNFDFAPSKIVVDTAERVYCVADNVNKGLIKYENDGTFSGFVGATPVSYNFWDWFWKHFASQEQLEKMANFVPTQYDNLYMDPEGFIYVCTSKPTEEDIKAESATVVRKLNLLGNDILVRNGSYPIYGDLYMGTGGKKTGPSRFCDITTLYNDIYICLDRNRGRLFGYDDQGHLVYAFGGTGNMDGYFNSAVSIDHIGKDLLVLDENDGAITFFVTTEYGNLIYDAIDKFDLGEYDASEANWRKVMEFNGNYDLAYIGIGRSLLRQKKYKEAMEYFELKHDAENYSKAFKQYRKQWVEEHIVLIVVIILLLFLVPLGIGRLKFIKHEIDTADIFQL